MRKFKFLMALLVLTMPMQLFAYTNNEIVQIGAFYIKVINPSAATACFLGTDGSISGALDIPEELFDNKDVTFTITEVGGNYSYKTPNITSVTLPPTIERILGSAFVDASLTTLNIPANVRYIDHFAWTYLKKTPAFTVDAASSSFMADSDGVLYSKDMSVLYAAPSSLPLTANTYTINDKVTKIMANAFHLPSPTNTLKVLVLPKNLTAVETGWPTIVPVPTIEEFRIASGGSTSFSVNDGVLFNGTELVLYPRGKKTTSYTVPAGITSIASYGLYANNSMQTLNLNEIVTLNNSSLYSLGNLTTVTLPKGLQEGSSLEGCIEACYKVNEYIVPADSENFYGENGIVFTKDKKKLYFYPPAKIGDSYIIPSTVETICRRAFQGSQLKTLTIPSNVKYINDMAFRGMSSLTTVTFEEASSVQKFGIDAFSWCVNLTTITLPSSLTELSTAFSYCKKLEIINVPDNSQLERIKSIAFTTNEELRQFNFLGSCALTTIESSAFANLKKFEAFHFPKSVTTIQSNAFSGCKGMKTATFANDAVITAIAQGAFANCGLTSISIPQSVKTIQKDAFKSCTVLETVQVSANLTTISSEAFKYCENLTNIIVDKNNTSYSSIDGYLLNKDKTTLVIFPPGKAKDGFTLLPPSITKIGDYAFYECKKLKNVTIPNKVTSIGIRAFGLCTALNTITFLCDEMIDPANINQALNTMSFDDGTQAASMFTNININVRQGKLAQYNASTFYKKFKSITPSFTDGTEEYIAVSDNAVDMLSSTRTDYTFVLPTSVTKDGKAYNVSLIGDYVFQSLPSSVKEVVVKDNVQYIGAKAFVTNIANNTSSIEKVFFIEKTPTKNMLSTTRFELDETNTNYNEFASTTKIYVKKSATDTYKTAWKKQVYKIATAGYVDSPFDFTSQIDYKIPDVSFTTKYGTFAREFDTDFSDYYATNSNSEVAAFVAPISGLTSGTGDYGTDGQYYVRMTSIDKNGGSSDSYGYIPANTGVLLKVLDKDQTSSDFYYTIGEKDTQTYTISNNILTGVTVNNTSVVATASEPVYVMQKGVFRKATTTIANFPVHKAYAKFTTLPAGAKVSFVFEDDNTTTGINDVSVESKVDDDAYYNLNGQRVSNPQGGVYIHQGRKVIIK